MGWLVLAAGKASRFGGDKMLARIPGDSVCVIEKTLSSVLETKEEILVVCRPGHAGLHQWLSGHNIPYEICPQAAEGMGNSLAWGVQKIQERWSWCGILPADMPFLQKTTLISLKNLAAEDKIVLPMLTAPISDRTGPVVTGKERRGHPVLFGRAFFAGLTGLQGDKGAQNLLKYHAAAVEKWFCTDPGVVRDIDTPEDFVTYCPT